MDSRLMIGAVIAGCILGLSGCAEIKADYDNRMATINHNNAVQSGTAMAVLPDPTKSKQTQLIVPNDKAVASAMNEALPTIKKVLAIHQCVKYGTSLRQLNAYAQPGVDVMNMGYVPDYFFPDSSAWMKFHDLNKCVSVRAIDNWSKPALNALLFRAVYFADDSGETVNYLYLFKKSDDGSWQIAQIEKGR